MTIYTAKLRQGYLQPRRLGDNFAFAPDKLWEIARQKPAFSLDFTKRSIVDRIAGVSGAFTRPTSTELAWDGTRFVSYAADQPAWAVGPSGLGGLQMAPGATNSVWHSRSLGTSPWVAPFAPTTNSDSLFPGAPVDGRYTVTDTNNTIFQPITCTASTQYTFSFFVKLVTLSSSDFLFAIRNDTAGVFIAQDIPSNVTLVAGQWARVSYTFTTPVGCVLVRPYVMRNVSGTYSGIVEFDQAQLETGPVATPPIVTAGAPLTRSADAFVFGPGAAFDSWYNQAGGVWRASFIKSSAVLGFIFAANDGTDNNRFSQFLNSTTLSSRHVVGGSASNPGDLTGNALSSNQAVLLSVAGLSRAALNGVLSSSLTPLSMPSINRLIVGNGISGGSINGIIHRLDYYPPGPAADRIQQLSAAVL